MRHLSEYERKQQAAAAAKRERQERQERFRQIAASYIEAGKGISAMAADFVLQPGDEELFEQTRVDLEHQQQLDESFLAGFSADPYSSAMYKK